MTKLHKNQALFLCPYVVCVQVRASDVTIIDCYVASSLNIRQQLAAPLVWTAEVRVRL